MNVLMVGNGKGSWTIRGHQLGLALGARVTSTPTDADWRWADVAVIVKRAGQHFAQAAHRADVPIVWDALDFWTQPADNRKTSDEAMRLLRDRLAEIRPALTIGATEQMATAARGVCLPHHAWPGLRPAPAKSAVRTVAYEGNPAYLGRWMQALLAACERRGWAFLVNPTDIRQADIIVALRDGVWDGWMCRQWKSGVKVVNALAAGRPIITQHSAAFEEIGHAGTVIGSVADLDAALDFWTPLEARAAVVAQSMEKAEAYTVAAMAERYAGLLAGVRERCVA